MRCTRQTCLFDCKLNIDRPVYFLATSLGGTHFVRMTTPAAAPEAVSAKRTHLMNTAQRLFYREGFRIVGIDTLLAEAGVAKMTLYNHFASKDELIVAVIEKLDADVRHALTAAVDAVGHSPTRRVLAVFDWLKVWFESTNFKGCAFIRALSEYPDPAHPIHQAAWRHKEAVNALLTQLAKDAGASRPAELASALSLLINGAILSAHATGSSAAATTARATAAILLKQATA
jgi:AcrR family transcriptional regulator